MTVEEKIDVVETLIEEYRWARNVETAPEHRIYGALKEIATDLRAATPAARSKVVDALRFQVDSAKRGKARIGYMEIGHMQALAEAVLAHWAVIKLALETKERVE